MPPTVKITKSELVYSGFNRIKKYFFEFSSFDGKTTFQSDKEVFDRKDAVAVLLYDPEKDAVVMIKQFRPGCFVADNIAFPIEIPAGLVDEGDTILEDVAKREAKEEANCIIEEIIDIGSYFPEISFSSRKIHLFCGLVDTGNIAPYGGLHHDQEDTKVFLLSFKELEELIKKREIINSHTLIAAQWFLLNRSAVRHSFLQRKTTP